MDERHRGRGHAIRPHTADVVIEAWGPDRDACLEEAVLACGEVVATGVAAATSSHRVSLAADDDDRLLVALLSEVITLVDVEGRVPLAAVVSSIGGALDCVLSLASIADLEIVGPGPKGVSYEGLTLRPQGTHWRARAILDV